MGSVLVLLACDNAGLEASFRGWWSTAVHFLWKQAPFDEERYWQKGIAEGLATY